MPRPNPMQTDNLDNVTLRRELKGMLAPDHILDRQELAELLDLSNTGHRLTAIRLRLLRYAISQLPAGMLLTDQQRGALISYRAGTGPRPPFTMFVSSDGQYGAHNLAPDDPDAPKPGPAWPQEDPNEPGRYVQPAGRFAQPQEDSFHPDTR